jgi:hypothetical protein
MTFPSGWNVGGSSSASIKIKVISSVYTVSPADNNSFIRQTNNGGAITLPRGASVGLGFNVTIHNDNPSNAFSLALSGSDTYESSGGNAAINPGQVFQLICVSVNSSGVGSWIIRQSGSGLGLNSTALGGSYAGGANSFAVGSSGYASGTDALAIGSNTTATVANGAAIGRNSSSQGSVAQTGPGAMALGGSYASGTDSFAAANADNTGTYGAQGANSIAIGKQAKATGSGSVSIGSTSTGFGSISVGAGAVAIGGAYASGVNSFSASIGSNNSFYGAQGSGSISIGGLTKSTTTNSVCIGANGISSGLSSISLGDTTYAYANYSTAIGSNSNWAGSMVASTGVGAVALGGSYASGKDSFAAANADSSGTFGALADNSIAIGYRATVTQAAGIAIGNLCSSLTGLAIGSNCSATGGAGAIGAGSNASGTASIAIGGTNSTASGSYSVAIGGLNVSATGSNSISIGGNSTSSGLYSVSLGNFSLSAITGKFAYSGTKFSSTGDCQQGVIVLLNTTTGSSAITLTSDGGAASTTNQVILTDNQAMTFNALITARQNTTGDTAAWNVSGCIKRGTGAASTALVGSVVNLSSSADVGAATWTAAISADTTNGGLKITVNGQAAKTIRWSATVYTNELAG